MNSSDHASASGGEAPSLPRILVVDDSGVFRDSLCQLLEDSGRVDIVGQAHDGRDAVEKARRLRPDLVLMDLQMPVMNGIEALRLIRQQPSPPEVVIMSFDESALTAEGLKNAGATAFFPKRTVIENLFEILPGLFPLRS